MEAKQDSNLWLGGFFVEPEHVHQHVAWTKCEFSAHLRFAPESFRAEPVRSLRRARPGRKSNRPHRLGISNRECLWARLSVHDFARTLQRSIAQGQQLLRLRYADG